LEKCFRNDTKDPITGIDWGIESWKYPLWKKT
jgi:hypothetical protein